MVRQPSSKKSLTTCFLLAIGQSSLLKYSEPSTKVKMYAILGKAKPHTENIKGLNLAVVIYTTVQVSRLLWDVWANNNQ
jgi:hypothetical protein